MPARLVALVGPTAGGKTDLGVALAQRIDAEIVSVDSRQVYRRLDIGTAKPDAAARAAVAHHLLDVVEPDQDFDAARFATLGRAVVGDILARGRNVLLVGGSGLYLRALTEGLCPAPPADPAIRAEMARELAVHGVAALHAELTRHDPEAAARIAPRDAVRIGRALEVVRITGRTLSAWQQEHRFADRPWDVLVLVLCPPAVDLETRIARRARQMWDAGLVAETEAVLAAGFAPELKPLQAIGYREAQEHLRGVLDRDQAIERMRIATRQYAKRQRTWFRALQGAQWLDGHEPHDELLRRIERHLDRGAHAAHVS
ncbi:tRNA (adenosine(37)-N6)-dimethylallyltransferase MiaA [Candidatus Binatia bacterium]|nr:tRNA (adenosine(37)-N6)-dimethylallyltransferase MiaA [Candidatus Binatia bacterium]